MYLVKDELLCFGQFVKDAEMIYSDHTIQSSFINITQILDRRVQIIPLTTAEDFSLVFTEIQKLRQIFNLRPVQVN